MRLKSILTSLFLLSALPLSAAHALIKGIVVTPENKLARSAVGIFEFYENRVWLTNCAGSVLGERFILTAAHCLKGKSPSHLAVNFSTEQLVYSRTAEVTDIQELEKRFSIRRVKDFLVHPDFDFVNGDHDFAVILLEDKIPSDAVPVSLLPDEFIDPSGVSTVFQGEKRQMTLFAAGIVDETQYTQSEAMRFAIVPGTFENRFVVTDQSAGSGACSGDSGGPAFMELNGVNYQVGVISGPHGNSETCHEEGELVNPAMERAFIENAKAMFSR